MKDNEHVNTVTINASSLVDTVVLPFCGTFTKDLGECSLYKTDHSESSQTVNIVNSVNLTDNNTISNDLIESSQTVQNTSAGTSAGSENEGSKRIETVISKCKCLYTNADQLCNKMDELELQIRQMCPDFIFIT